MINRTLIFPLWAIIFIFAPAAFSAEGSGPSRLSVGQTLEDFFTAAIDFSPRLRIAAEELNIGRARDDQAQGQLHPQINANANLTSNTRNSFDFVGTPVSEDFDGERYSISVQQVLFNWQAFAARRRTAKIENQLEADYYYELSFLLTDVAERYLGVLLAQDSLTSIDAEIEAVANQVNQIQSLFSLQLAQITDLRQAEASLAAVEAEQLRLEAESALALERLRALTGIEIGNVSVLSEESQLPRVQNNLEYWINSANRNNQQIKARRFRARGFPRGDQRKQRRIFASRQLFCHPTRIECRVR